GCGTGSLAKTLVATTRQSTIVGIDPVAPFIEYARDRVTDPRASFEVGDATALPYPPASFDHALAMLVLHFIPRSETAAAEMRRVTRSGGTVAACTWDGEEMELSKTFWDEAARLDPSADAKRHHQLNRPGQLAALWHTTGLQDVEETALE